jgi:hypothetical protein
LFSHSKISLKTTTHSKISRQMRDLNVLGGVGQEVNVEARFVFFGEMQRLGFWHQTGNFVNICHLLFPNEVHRMARQPRVVVWWRVR